jgi:hypothetical protein
MITIFRGKNGFYYCYDPIFFKSYIHSRMYFKQKTPIFSTLLGENILKIGPGPWKRDKSTCMYLILLLKMFKTFYPRQFYSMYCFCLSRNEGHSGEEEREIELRS